MRGAVAILAIVIPSICCGQISQQQISSTSLQVIGDSYSIRQTIGVAVLGTVKSADYTVVQGIYLTKASITGLTDELVETYNLYPNPTSDFFYSASTSGLHSLIVQDLFGRTVMDIPTAENSTSIGVSTLPAGFYLVTIIDKISKLKVIQRLIKE